MCGLKEIFEGAGNFFDKKVLANPTLHLEKLNLIRFIKALLKGFTPHMFPPTASAPSPQGRRL